MLLSAVKVDNEYESLAKEVSKARLRKHAQASKIE